MCSPIKILKVPTKRTTLAEKFYYYNFDQKGPHSLEIKSLTALDLRNDLQTKILKYHLTAYMSFDCIHTI